MIVRSILSVSCPLCDAPLVLNCGRLLWTFRPQLQWICTDLVAPQGQRLSEHQGAPHDGMGKSTMSRTWPLFLVRANPQIGYLACLQDPESLYRARHHTVAHCNTLQHTTTQYSTLQQTASRCNTLHHTATQVSSGFGIQKVYTVQCITLYHTMAYCNRQ